MNKIKVGFVNFGLRGKFLYQDITMKEFINSYILNPLTDFFQIQCCDPKTEECDYVFVSIFPDYGKYTYKNELIGKPTIIFFNFEHPTRCNNWAHSRIDFDYSISYYPDSDKNLYCPLWWLDNFEVYKNNKNSIVRLPANQKTNFCTFITRNLNGGDLAIRRASLVDYISGKYKKIDCCGRIKNNMPNSYILSTDMRVAQEFHKNYKFNLCFENESSKDDICYVTEKLLNAFLYGVVPIYYGPKNIGDYFNVDSFINCYDLSDDEILQRIIEIDKNDDVYNKMLMSDNFIDMSIDYTDIAKRKICEFIIKIHETKQ